jgi:hypothetical protein
LTKVNIAGVHYYAMESYTVVVLSLLKKINQLRFPVCVCVLITSYIAYNTHLPGSAADGHCKLTVSKV